MEKKENKCTCTCNQTEKSADYPGVAINIADDEKVDSKLVKERTEELNNNPRNDY